MAVYKGRTADIKIKPSTTEHILQHCHDEDTYSVTSPRGRLLLINNQEFDTPVYPEQKHLNDRPGSEIDCDRLEELFKQLDFIVKVQENVSSKFMTELLEKETRVEEQEQYGMFILIILSHGDESCIYGKDGCPLYYKDIYKQLSARSFRAMAGKPKLLLFQACSGSSTEKSQLNEDSREVDDEAAAVSGSFKARPQTAQISANSDLLIIRSSFPGYVSARRGDKGSHLMRVFIEVMQQYSCQEELEILSKKVRSTVYNLCEEDKAMFDKYGHQTIHSSSTLTKSLYFFPGYDPTKPPQNELEPVLTADGASSIGCDSQPDHNPDIATEPPKPAPRTSRQKLTAQPEVDLDRVIREHDNFDDDLSSSAEPIINQELIFTTDEDVKKLFAHPNVYKMSVGCRGRALILNNVEFEQKVNPDQDDLDYREGSDVDCTNIKTVLEKLGFIVTVKTDRDTRQMRNEIQKETEREDQAHYGMFILVVLSHGDRDVVYGSDGRKISSDDIVDLLKPQKFVGMKGKPKWIIQQTCSGVKADNVQPDSNPADVPPLQRTNKTAQPYTSVSDLYILKSSFPGYMSLRDPKYGSYMIQDLVKVLYRYAAHKDLQSLTTEVRNRVMERSGTGIHGYGVQTVFVSETLLKKIYLFPGYKSQLPILDKPMNIPIRLSETPSNTNTLTTLCNPVIPVLPIPTCLKYRRLCIEDRYSSVVHNEIPTSVVEQTSELQHGSSTAAAEPATANNLEVELVCRRSTFEGWRFEHVQKAEDLVQAGFYYMGFRDVVKCLSCDLSYGNWTSDENPVKRHLKFKNPNCPFAREVLHEPIVQIEPIHNLLECLRINEVNIPAPVETLHREPVVNHRKTEVSAGEQAALSTTSSVSGGISNSEAGERSGSLNRFPEVISGIKTEWPNVWCEPNNITRLDLSIHLKPEEVSELRKVLSQESEKIACMNREQHPPPMISSSDEISISSAEEQRFKLQNEVSLGHTESINLMIPEDASTISTEAPQIQLLNPVESVEFGLGCGSHVSMQPLPATVHTAISAIPEADPSVDSDAEYEIEKVCSLSSTETDPAPTSASITSSSLTTEQPDPISSTSSENVNPKPLLGPLSLESRTKRMADSKTRSIGSESRKRDPGRRNEPESSDCESTTTTTSDSSSNDEQIQMLVRCLDEKMKAKRERRNRKKKNGIRRRKEEEKKAKKKAKKAKQKGEEEEGERN